MNFRTKVASIFLRFKQRSFLTTFRENLSAKKEVFFGVALLLNIGVLVGAFYVYQKQLVALTQQTEVIGRISTLQNRLDAANTQATNNANTLQQIQSVVAQIARDQAAKPSTVLGTNTTTDKPAQVVADASVAQTSPSAVKPDPLGIVQVNLSTKDGKVIYDSPAKQQIIENVKPGTVMLFYKKDGGFYQVDPPTHFGVTGWIQQDGMTEVPNVTELPK